MVLYLPPPYANHKNNFSLTLLYANKEKSCVKYTIPKTTNRGKQYPWLTHCRSRQIMAAGLLISVHRGHLIG